MSSGDFPTLNDMGTHTHSLSLTNHAYQVGTDKDYYYGSSCNCGCGIGGGSVKIGGFVTPTATAVANLPLPPLQCTICKMSGMIIQGLDGLSYCLICYGYQRFSPQWLDPELEKLKPELEKLREEFNKLKAELQSAEETIKFYDEVTVYSLECDKANLNQRLDVANEWAAWHSDNHQHLSAQIEKLASFITAEVPGELQSEGAIDTAIRIIKESQEKKAGIEEGDLVQDASQKKGPYYAIRETLVDIITTNRTHRMPGWILKDSQGKYLELPTSTLAHYQPLEEPAATPSPPLGTVMYIALELGVLGCFLYSLLANISIILQ